MAMATTDQVAEFMEGLTALGRVPSMRKVTGTLRFDVVDGDRTAHWLLTITKGDLAVSRKKSKADVVLRGERPLFEQLVQGKANPTAAFLRGALAVEGDVELIVLVQRLLPRPGNAAATGATAGWAGRPR
jgi:hypothetical protein